MSASAIGRLAAVDNGHQIEQFFGSASPLSTVLAGYSPRREQLEMAQAVSDTLLTGERLVVEAGTGTGKTLAYLIPVLLSGQRVIISTGTKTLQDQLYHRDLPVVAQVLGRPATIVQLKGRANYLCLHRLELLRQGRASDVGRFDRQAYTEVDQWSRLTRSGDIAEVHGVPEDSGIWPLVTSTVENCLGAQCNFYERCHVVSARQAATSADIVVVNHHLLLADLILKDEGFGELLPEFEAVIIDEAHQFPDIAQRFFNLSMSSARLLDLLRDLQLEALSAGAHDQALEALLDSTSKSVREARLLLPESAADVPWRDIDPDFGGRMEELTAGLDQLVDWLVALDESPIGLQRARERLAGTIDTLEQLLCADETAGLRWLSLTRLGFGLNYTPIDVADSLNDLVDAQSCAWVFTSATLAVGEDFGHFLRRMGMANVRTEQIPSPFDFSSA
ncbi:MAG: ATP-dependent DNA helicase, partial [Gammaproteobacteria bacterium]